MSATFWRILLAAAIVSATLESSACAMRLAPPKPASESGRARGQDDFGIRACPGHAEKDLLSPDALQCWFTASHDRWRTLNHQSHLEALVVEVEARDLRDAVEIAQRVTVDMQARAFSEILVYVARPQGGDSRIRRVRWTRNSGFETLDFSSPAGTPPLTVVSSPSGTPTGPQPQR
jgi:hypothetical protein